MSVHEQKSLRRMRGQAAEPRIADRQIKVAMAAYFIAEKRGFEPGHELEDWLAAEAEITQAEPPSVLTSMELSPAGRAS